MLPGGLQVVLRGVYIKILSIKTKSTVHSYVTMSINMLVLFPCENVSDELSYFAFLSGLTELCVVSELLRYGQGPEQ